MRPFCHLALRHSRPETYGYFIDHPDLANRIRQRRRELGANQRICALQLGVSYKTLQNWETGRTRPALNLASQLMKFLREIA